MNYSNETLDGQTTSIIWSAFNNQVIWFRDYLSKDLIGSGSGKHFTPLNFSLTL